MGRLHSAHQYNNHYITLPIAPLKILRYTLLSVILLLHLQIVERVFYISLVQIQNSQILIMVFQTSLKIKDHVRLQLMCGFVFSSVSVSSSSILIHPSVHPSIHPILPSFYLSIRPFVHLSVCPSIHQSNRPYVHLSIPHLSQGPQGKLTRPYGQQTRP